MDILLVVFDGEKTEVYSKGVVWMFLLFALFGFWSMFYFIPVAKEFFTFAGCMAGFVAYCRDSDGLPDSEEAEMTWDERLARMEAAESEC